MKAVIFDPNGGLLYADIRSGYANPGAYRLILWEKNSNATAMPDVRGNFINAHDDRHQLDSNAAANDGRIVEAFVTISPPVREQGVKWPYLASMRIIQDNEVLDDISYGDSTDQPSVTIDLFARLRSA